MRRTLGAAVGALLVLVVVLGTLFHNSVMRFALQDGVGIATGYWVKADEVRFGSRHGALVNVRVSRGGEPVLEARRIDLDYNPRDLLPGSKHRFGISAVAIDRPHITIVHHENGTYNVFAPPAVASGTRSPRGIPNGTPIDVAIRVRDASATLIDKYRFYQTSRVQSVDRIDADAHINSVVKTWYKVTGYLEDNGSQHFRMAGTMDYVRGYALHHVNVQAVPIATIGNYFINSPAAHILGGEVRGLDLQMWAFDSPWEYHMAGAGDLSGGHIVVRGLDSPIRDLAGRITLFDSGFASQRLTARVGHIPIVCSGGIFDFSNPQFRLGVEGSGDLADLSGIMRIAKGLPLSGGLKIHALIEGAIDNPVLMIGFDGRHWNYGAVPIDIPRGTVALYKNDLIVLPFHATYAGMKLHIQGDLKLGAHVQSTLVLHALGPSSAMPYLGALLPDQPLLSETLLHGDDLKIDAMGYITSLTDPQNINGFYHLDRYGVGTFGPIALQTPSGGSLVAGFTMNRRSGDSAFWASAKNIRMRQPQTIRMPGVSIPELPPIDAQITDANIAGSGSANNVVVGGSVHMAPATIAGVPFSSIAASFAGPFAASRLSSVRAQGPWGSFDGNGTFGSSVFAARGDYAGTLQGLHTFFGGISASGSVHGPVAIAIAQGKIFVQAQNAQLAGADIHGIPITSVSGTMSFVDNRLKIYSAQANAAGGRIEAAGSFATVPGGGASNIALVTTPLDAASLHGLGVPLTRGRLQAAGTLSPGAGAIPDLNAGVVLSNGDLLGYGPFDTSAEIAIENDALHIRAAEASLGSTFAHVSGTIGNLSGSVPSYDIAADVPAGSIGAMAQLGRVPTYNTDGSFEGSLVVQGTGAHPRVSGTLRVPVGEVNGQGFRDATATVSATAGGASIRNAGVWVGSTNLGFSATVGKDQLAFSMHAPHADLTDFNDYFDTGDTLAGKGAVNVAFSHFDRLTFTSGDIDVLGLRYRRFPIGDTDATWTGVRNVVQGRVSIGGEHGLLKAVGTIGFAPSAGMSELVLHSRYNLSGTLSNFDLSTWLPALGFPQLPVTGRVNGGARLRGAYPHFDLALRASLHDGTLGPLPIETAQLSAHSAPGDRITVTNLVFALPALQATGSGSFGLNPAQPIAMQLHAHSSDVARIVAQATKKKIDLTGTFDSTIALAGTMRAPTIAAGVEGTNVSAYGVHIPSFVGQLQLHRKDLVVRNAEFTFAHGTATIAGALPLQLSPFAFGPVQAPISLDATAQNVDLSEFAAFLGNNTKLTGTLSGHLGVSGTVRNPKIFGQVAAANAGYQSALETTPVTGGVAQLTFNGTSATLGRLHLGMGRGVVDGTGGLNFGGGLNGGPLGYAIALVARGAQLNSPQFGSATLDSNLSLARDPGRLAHLRGTVAISDAIIPFSSFLGSGPPPPGTAPSGPPLNLGFDLAITAGKNVRVRGGGAGLFGLDIAGQGAVQLTGTLQRPAMAGEFNSAGGTLTYIDHAFKIQQGNVNFNPANGVLPDIYAVATTHVTNPDPNTARNPTGYADITASVSGTVPNVKVSFTSSPPGYSEQQIIALLLPLGGLIGPIQFTDTGVILPAGQLANAPAIPSGALLPDIFVRRQNGTVTIGQEAFNILNTQFASGILAPVESALSNTLGLSDVDLTVDYSGAFGLNVRRLLGSNFFALYGTTFTIPVRQTFGFAYQPNAFTSAQFTMFVQQGSTPLFFAPNQTLSTNPRASAGQAVQGQNGFTFLFQRLF